MSEWKSVCEMPENFFGDVWVFSKHLERPELARTHLEKKFSGQVVRVFQTIYSVDDSDGWEEHFDDVTHYMEVVPPKPPTEFTGE